ncbi:hypothetical protein A5630_00770 [Mycolicibacterium mucogenicum]|uniref:Swt1-like HEPN domain-containing protein n=1 Tax=Mycolicibacterium mucogenicum TaxID=56689 RepID=A0A1A3HEN0_MYCMU|nr:Swt1 family HEPN domain-containing protein [Mycolicibacterium mucogenicum]OBJ46535.1 hypothetical protein A5630_00770 [Mycolicibacterium mucogenicum]
MNRQATLREFLFKGLAVEDALNELEEQGLGVRAPSDTQALQRVVSLEEFPASLRSAAMQALPAYMAFFCLENSARELISERMAERHGTDWWDKVSRSIQEKVEKRQAQEGKDRWHMKRGATHIYYTDFGDLKAIIQLNWADFEDLFPDVNWVITRFTELEASRNIVAHNNVLEKNEIDRIKMYLVDWVRQVG